MIIRRSFLSTLASVCASVSVHRFAMALEQSKTIDIALVSDSHIHRDVTTVYRGFNPADHLSLAVEQILSTNCSMSFLCGDVARADGHRDDYLKTRELLKPLTDRMPMHVAMGNHDDRSNFMSAFDIPDNGEPIAGKKHVTIADLGPQRWIVLDSLMYVDKVPGLLGQEQREWLDRVLARDRNKPTLLMVHHTLGPNDGDLLDTDRLLTICQKHEQVKGVFFGHSHKWSIEKKDNLYWINLPALGYNFQDTQPVGWVHARVSPNELTLTPRVIGGNTSDDSKSVVLKIA